MAPLEHPLFQSAVRAIRYGVSTIAATQYIGNSFNPLCVQLDMVIGKPVMIKEKTIGFNPLCVQLDMVARCLQSRAQGL